MNWETVYENDNSEMLRAAVPGGWLYLHKSYRSQESEYSGDIYSVLAGESMAFVPDAAAKP